MKKRSVILLLAAMLVLCSCSSEDSSVNYDWEKAEQGLITREIEGYGLELDYPYEWEDVTAGSGFDLKCKNKYTQSGIYVYYDIDLAEGSTPDELMEMQTNNLLESGYNTELVSEKTVSIDGKTIRSLTYNSDYDEVKFLYYFNHITFDDNPEKFVWIVYTAIPSIGLQEKNTWDDITRSIRIIED